jgi:hypothetical protein
MATTILITCPECGKQAKAPEQVFGKKVRCKGCQAVFVAKPAGGKAAPGKPAKKPAAKPAKSVDDKDETPYDLQDMSFAPRCPNCANELESEDDTVCLICGYDNRKREQHKMVKVYGVSFFEHAQWLLPGIACVLVCLVVIGFNIWYQWQITELVSWESDSWYIGMWAIGGIRLWVTITSLFIVWICGRFAVKRLVLHFRPPEVEKLK